MCQGEHLQRGSRLADFDIRLGDAAWIPVSLTDNQVDCRPSPRTPDDTFCDSDKRYLCKSAQPRTLAVNVTLLAFDVERRAVVPLLVGARRCHCPHGAQQPGMLRPQGPCGLEAKSFCLGLSLGLTFSGFGLDLGLMASGLIEIGLVASNIYSSHDII